MASYDDLGGDPPCWAHLFEEELGMGGGNADSTDNAIEPVDLAVLAASQRGQGAVWSQTTEDLNINLLAFNAGKGVDAHINTEVDVLLVGVMGGGTVVIDGHETTLREGEALIVPKGAQRSTKAGIGRFAYLSIHKARAGLIPGGGRDRNP
ncbi:MAG: hypothetical protein IT337_04910 [Thermomicrobiales bacterium]|nr:hypothetical protein [Thermomicrobiales bacterium]